MTALERLAVIAAGVVAVGAPVLTLGLWPQPAPQELPSRPLLLAGRPAVSIAAAYSRSVFGEIGGGDAAATAAVPDDAPELAGIVGRIGADAVALVRTDGGRTRSVPVGQAVDGWVLESLSIDAAAFTRGGQRVRVPLPTGDDGEQSGVE